MLYFPSTTLVACASYFTDRRLRQQMLEAAHVLSYLCDDKYQRLLSRDEAEDVTLWQGHEHMLKVHLLRLCIERKKRRMHNPSDRLENFQRAVERLPIPPTSSMNEPWWWDGPLHEKHREKLGIKEGS